MLNLNDKCAGRILFTSNSWGETRIWLARTWGPEMWVSPALGPPMTLLTAREKNVARLCFTSRCKGVRRGPEVELRLTSKRSGGGRWLTLLDWGLYLLLLTIFSFAKGSLLCTSNTLFVLWTASQFVRLTFVDQIPASTKRSTAKKNFERSFKVISVDISEGQTKNRYFVNSQKRNTRAN